MKRSRPAAKGLRDVPSTKIHQQQYSPEDSVTFAFTTVEGGSGQRPIAETRPQNARRYISLEYRSTGDSAVLSQSRMTAWWLRRTLICTARAVCGSRQLRSTTVLKVLNRRSIDGRPISMTTHMRTWRKERGLKTAFSDAGLVQREVKLPPGKSCFSSLRHKDILS